MGKGKKKKLKIVNWQHLVEYLNNAKNILIVSKGKTNTDIHKIEENYDICIGIKQSIMLLNKKNVLVMNDLEGLFGLEHCIKEIKYIICPIRTHVGSKPNNNGNNLFLNYLRGHKYKGKVVFYRFRSQEDNSLLHIEKTCSGDIIHNFLDKCSNKKQMRIHHLGLYTSLKDNLVITEKILKAEVLNSYKKIYNNWVSNKYKNKKSTNVKFLAHVHPGISKENLMKESQKGLQKKFPNLNLQFFSDIETKDKFFCFIPARYSSSRLPGKPLLKINVKTIIRRVHEQVQT